MNPNILGPSYDVWLKLQHGQEKITRFNRYLPFFKETMRHQNGHEHRCSVSFLFDYMMIRMRPFCILDELLLTRCISHHDIPEGISGIDLAAHLKTDNDDLKEYLIFEELCKPLGKEFWRDMQEAFLLQFCLDNPECFPSDARETMSYLAIRHHKEALFFQGVQKFDYLYYAYECFRERGIVRILKEVAQHQYKALDEIAEKLEGFGQVVWTQEIRISFREFAEKSTGEEPVQHELKIA